MKREYTKDEIMSGHAHARPHEICGYKLHGGFDDSGNYITPRTLHRWPAVKAWEAQLKERDWPLIDADETLLSKGSYPTYPQQKMRLDLGMGTSLWNALSITGAIEANGRMLIALPCPDFQKIIQEDLTETATGHLTKGLLDAHGMDEGGDPNSRLGGHDSMWYALRDLVFGANAYPLPEIPESISRPETEERLIASVPLEYEGLILLLMNVLMIEVRAGNAFTLNLNIFKDPQCFPEKRADAEQAALMVARIAQDEEIHVAYLRAVLSEMRSFTFVGANREKTAGKDIIDPAWKELVQWHGIENPRLTRERIQPGLEEILSQPPLGQQTVEQFNKLDT